jgi:hypothetical protein
VRFEGVLYVPDFLSFGSVDHRDDVEPDFLPYLF